MMWQLKLPFNQNLIIINHKLNDDFNVTSLLNELKMDTRIDVLEKICDVGYGGICVVTTITNL
jgi:hypothetical protein